MRQVGPCRGTFSKPADIDLAECRHERAQQGMHDAPRFVILGLPRDIFLDAQFMIHMRNALAFTGAICAFARAACVLIAFNSAPGVNMALTSSSSS